MVEDALVSVTMTVSVTGFAVVVSGVVTDTVEACSVVSDFLTIDKTTFELDEVLETVVLVLVWLIAVSAADFKIDPLPLVLLLSSSFCLIFSCRSRSRRSFSLSTAIGASVVVEPFLSSSFLLSLASPSEMAAFSLASLPCR